MNYKIHDKISIIPFLNLEIECDNIGLKDYISWFNDPEINEFTSHAKFPFTKMMAYDYQNYLQDNPQKIIVWAIIYQDVVGIFHIGNVCLQDIDIINRSAELGIIIGEKGYHTRGIGTAVCKKVLFHGFCKLNLNRIWLGTPVNNLKMKRVAEKIGMKQESTEYGGFYYFNEYIDVCKFSILRKEYFK